MSSPVLATTFDPATGSLLVSGDVDESSGPQFRDAISKSSEDFTRDLILDLGQVEYFPSLAVGLLATAQRRATEAGVSLDVLAPEGSLAQRVLAVCGLPHRTV